MNYEAIVIGGGIGGLTVAALLARRGVKVCLLERQSAVGGCVANFEHLGYEFEPTFGLYRGWETGGICNRVFSELRVSPPAVEAASYTVLLPDGVSVPFEADLERFAPYLRAAFPDCAEGAVDFYRQITQPTAHADRRSEAVAAHLERCSSRFRRFIDIQLQTFVQSSTNECLYDEAAEVLNPQHGYWTIEGGAQGLAEALARSLKESGGTVRLNSNVLRLAYGHDGTPIGVDLLTGERIIGTRAIISNLTVWDTVGKLIGLSKTPATISSQLKRVSAWGVYLAFLSLDRSAMSRLPSTNILALTDWQQDESFDPERAHFVFSATPHQRAPEGKIPVTVASFTHAQDWFSFHEDHAAHEEQDQATLETLWTRLHAAMPELGDSLEVIETATPQTFYDSTRRKFGMIGRPVLSTSSLRESLRRQYPNLSLVGDTVASGFGLAGLMADAMEIANSIADGTPQETYLPS